MDSLAVGNVCDSLRVIRDTVAKVYILKLKRLVLR